MTTPDISDGTSSLGVKKTNIFLHNILVLFTHLSLCGTLASEATKNWEKMALDEALKLYILAADGDEKSVSKAESIVKKILEGSPKQFEAHAILGGVYTLKARRSFWANKKISYVKRGMEMMDKAVEGAPKNLTIRWVRGSNNIHMPKFLNRFDLAKNDLEIVWEKIMKNADDFPILRKQKTGHLFGMALYKSGEKEKADKTWKTAIEFAPDSIISKKISQTSKKLKSNSTDQSKLGPGRFRR